MNVYIILPGISVAEISIGWGVVDISSLPDSVETVVGLLASGNGVLVISLSSEDVEESTALGKGVIATSESSSSMKLLIVLLQQM